jgi:competence ComEA-like helix-hairpin-helix protein
MFNLTRQERQVILFLTSLALAGMGVNFAMKVNSSAERIFKPDERIGKFNVNQVSLEELLSTRRIAPKLAKTIIEHRDLHGPFSDIEGLKDVKGIGDYRYERLKSFFYAE